MSASLLMHIMFSIPAGLITVRSTNAYASSFFFIFFYFTKNWEKSSSHPFNSITTLCSRIDLLFYQNVMMY